MDAHLNHIDPVQLHSVWPLVESGLATVRKRSRANWIAADVYAAIRAGHSTLHTAHMDGACVGFVVLTPTLTWDGKTLHIWCAYSLRPGLNLTQVFLPQIEEIALGIGARRVTFWSPRRFDKHVAKFGYEPGQVEYSKELR